MPKGRFFGRQIKAVEEEEEEEAMPKAGRRPPPPPKKNLLRLSHTHTAPCTYACKKKPCFLVANLFLSHARKCKKNATLSSSSTSTVPYLSSGHANGLFLLLLLLLLLLSLCCVYWTFVMFSVQSSVSVRLKKGGVKEWLRQKKGVSKKGLNSSLLPPPSTLNLHF